MLFKAAELITALTMRIHVISPKRFFRSSVENPLEHKEPSFNFTYTTKQDSLASRLVQTGFAAFDKGLQRISGSPYD